MCESESKARAGLKATRQLCTAAIAVGIAVLSWQPSLAAPIIYNADFSTRDQSLYSSGAGAVYRGSADIGPTWNVFGDAGGFGYGLFGERYGQYLWGASSGALQLKTRFQATAGDVRANVPTSISLFDPIINGRTATIGSSYSFRDGLGFHVNGPQIGAGVDLYASVYAGAGGETCAGFFGCSSYGGTFLNFDYSLPIVGFNDNFNSKITALGYDITGAITGGVDPSRSLLTYPIKISPIPPGAPGHESAPGYTVGRVSVNPLPFINAGVNGDGSTALGLTDIANIGAASLDVTNLLAINLGLPPLNDSYGLGLFSYNLLRATLGVGIGTYGNFDLDLPSGIRGRMTLLETGQIFNFNVGQNFSFMLPEELDYITLLPSFDLIDPLFSSEFGISLSPFVDVSALQASFLYGALGIGPLFHHNYTYDYLTPPFWDNSFALGGFNSFTGEPMRLSLPPIVAVPEPATVALLSAGLVGLAWMRRRTKGSGLTIDIPKPKPRNSTEQLA